MVPIHESDVAENHWSQAEWHHYELWEKIERRLKMRRWVWIGAAALLFFFLSSVPVIMERWPRWCSLAAAGHLSQEIGWVKREANVRQKALRLRIEEQGRPDFVIEEADRCTSASWSVVKTGSLLAIKRMDSFHVLSRAAGEKAGVPGLVQSFCYDHLTGSDAALRGQDVVGFGIASVKDLSVARFDRMSIVLLSGISAEISFE
jgi:hypothetical protein